VSSSNYPRFLNNPNTADGIYKNSTYQIADNTVYIDTTRPSSIILPDVEMSTEISQPKLPRFSQNLHLIHGAKYFHAWLNDTSLSRVISSKL
jgi:hypothetical protein